MASEVPIFPTFSALVITHKLGNPGRQEKNVGQREICKYRGESEAEGGRKDWSVVLMVVTDVEFSTKRCQEPSCQSEVS